MGHGYGPYTMKWALHWSVVITVPLQRQRLKPLPVPQHWPGQEDNEVQCHHLAQIPIPIPYRG